MIEVLSVIEAASRYAGFDKIAAQAVGNMNAFNETDRISSEDLLAVVVRKIEDDPLLFQPIVQTVGKQLADKIGGTVTITDFNVTTVPLFGDQTTYQMVALARLPK